MYGIMLVSENKYIIFAPIAYSVYCTTANIIASMVVISTWIRHKTKNEWW